MSAEYIKLILDIVILIGLGGFMYYALRLSRALNAFRAHRNEFDIVMKQLSGNIQDAQDSIKTLKAASSNSSTDIDKTLQTGRFLLDDLEIMIKSGNNLAKRLEKLTEGSARAIKGASMHGNEDYGENVSTMPGRRKSVDDRDNFMIQDREFEEDDFTITGEDTAGIETPETLTSDAEKELYQALQKTTKKPKRKKA